MINQLASPLVCVVDDEPEDYQPILTALNGLFVSCVHILGSDIDQLPAQPFRQLQLVFLDLHLTKSIGKDAASHTANVFTKLVSSDTAPIVVVIWSKYAQDRGEDGETESDLFKRTLLDAEPKFKGKLIFVEMEKPKPDERREDWTTQLRDQIGAALADQASVEALWTWHSLVRGACTGVAEGLTSVAASAGSGDDLKECLKDAMQRLAKAQGEGDFTEATAPGHLRTVLIQLLLDQLDHADGNALSEHGAWLVAEPARPPSPDFNARMNGLLLTAAADSAQTQFFPGTVYRVADDQGFVVACGQEGKAALLRECTKIKETQTEKWRAWHEKARVILVEISPACDVAQGNRINALLVAGLVVPAALAEYRKEGDSFRTLPILHLRWPSGDFVQQDAAVVLCHRFRVTIPVAAVPAWLDPWFRFRELPTASLGAAHASNAARIGYVQMA